jgi:hypothetical protein
MVRHTQWNIKAAASHARERRRCGGFSIHESWNGLSCSIIRLGSVIYAWPTWRNDFKEPVKPGYKSILRDDRKMPLFDHRTIYNFSLQSTQIRVREFSIARDIVVIGTMPQMIFHRPYSHQTSQTPYFPTSSFCFRSAPLASIGTRPRFPQSEALAACLRPAAVSHISCREPSDKPIREKQRPHSTTPSRARAVENYPQCRYSPWSLKGA